MKARLPSIALCSFALACGGSTPAPLRPTVVAPQNPEAIDAGVDPAGPPATSREEVMDVYHGVSVSDPYRWLEANGDARVKAWSAAQNAYTRRLLDGLPDRSAIQARIEQVFKSAQPS